MRKHTLSKKHTSSRTSTAEWKQIRRTRLAHAREHAEHCYRCQLPIDYDIRWPDKASPEIDHIVPFNVGGTDHPSNLAISHKGCNSRFGDGTRHRPPPTQEPDIRTNVLCGRCLQPTTARDGITDCHGAPMVSQDWRR